MPQFGESVVEGTVGKWLIAEGQPVRKDAPLLQLVTDKIETELPAPATGILRQILVPEGQTVAKGTVLAVIGEAEGGRETTADRQPAATPLALRLAAEQGVDITTISGTGLGGRITKEDVEALLTAAPIAAPSTAIGFISPAVARIAAEHAVDLAQITGTGEGGRITKKDVQAFIAGQPARTVAPSAGWRYDANDAIRRTAVQEPAAGPYPAEELMSLSPMRRAIAQHMTHSIQSAPQVTTVMEADLTRVVRARERLKDEFARQAVRLTFTPFFLQAIIAGLQVVPEANSSFREDALVIHRRIHIGLAVAVPDGLIVPVIRDAGAMSLLGLARAVNDLAERGRRQQLTPDETQGGTFTLTNHGTAGSLFATPIIVPPQAGILGIGAIQKRPVVISRGHPLLPDAEDVIAIHPMAYLSFTFDHRVLDGQGADRFLAAVKQFLESYSG